MSYVLQEYYTVPWRKLLRLRTLMTTSVKGSLLMKVKNTYEENLFTSRHWSSGDDDGRSSPVTVSASSIALVSQFAIVSGQVLHLQEAVWAWSCNRNRQLASRLVSPRTKSECGQEWLPALDTIYLHHVEYVPVMFKLSTNDMCFSTPWQKAWTTAKQWRCQSGPSSVSCNKRKSDQQTHNFSVASMFVHLCVCASFAPEVKGWMMFWGATIRNVLNAIAYSMCVAVRLSFLFASMRFLGDASLLCSLAQD